jgi:arsenate reductase (glutaredoxin)
MHTHAILIERPVVQSPKGTRLCRPPERVEDLL